MIIRKLFKGESSHIVRNCSSERCKKSIHGHSQIIEVKLKADTLDAAQMIVDFGLLKGTIGELTDSFDHAYIMWDRESTEFQNFIENNSDRYIRMPVSPSAEMLSLMMFAMFEIALEKTQFKNGEKPSIYSVTYHETTTGYAESFREDYEKIWVDGGYKIQDIYFSDGIRKEWKDPDMWYKLCHTQGPVFVNPEVELTH